jgi:hypothetical protein
MEIWHSERGKNFSLEAAHILESHGYGVWFLDGDGTPQPFSFRHLDRFVGGREVNNFLFQK